MINQYDIVQLQDGRIAMIAEILEPDRMFLVDVFAEIPAFALWNNGNGEAENGESDTESGDGFTMADLTASDTITEQVYFDDIANVFEEILLNTSERNELTHGR